jgi:2-polyprenyl-3-methyl-5-hydroxy-6-metoxy-1,4-benzoquinol methylase
MDNKYNIIRDPDYGYLRIDPIPSQEEVERYYQEEFYSSEYKSFNDSALEVQKEEQEFFDSRWESVCNTCNQYFGNVKGLSIFDIGFGFAQALLYFSKKGMMAKGLEPSPEGVEYASSMGLEVYQSGIEDFSCVGDERFDVVTIFNVLEHLRNPVETLVNIKEKLLNPGGLLVIDVPNEFNDFQTTANVEFNLNDWWVSPPVHINYFSTSSLKNLLEACDYKVHRSESAFPLEIFMLMGDVYVGNGELGKICHRRRVNFEHLLKKHGKGEKLSQFYEALASLNLGRQVTVYATY